MNEIFDSKQALSIAGGDHQLLRELLDLFEKESPKMLNRIDEAVKKQDGELLQCAAHTLKGALANLGATTALEIALTLETMGVNNELETADIVIERLRQCIQEFNRIAGQKEFSS